MDERSMIIEQERQKKAKKRKKYKKWKWMAGILAVVLVVGSVWYIVQGRYLMEASQTTTVEIVATEDQTITYAYIEAIGGNEITYRITEEPVTITGDAENNTSFDMSNMPQGMERPEGMEMPEGGFGDEIPEGMEMPEGGFSGQMLEGMEMPEGGFGGERPEGMEMPEGGFGGQRTEGGERTEETTSESGDTPIRGGRGQRGDMPDGQRADASGGTDAPGGTDVPGENAKVDETYTTYIPVGTDVTTKLGTVTTFSRLAAGDTVALVMEEVNGEQVIVAVYIVG